MTRKELDIRIDNKISSILKATADYQNNPDKAKDYIIITVLNIYKAGITFGREDVIDDIFNGHEGD